MAIWQYHMFFIPRQPVITKFGFIPDQIDIDQEGWTIHFETGDLESKPEFEDAFTINWWESLNLNLNEIVPRLAQFGEIQEWTANAQGLRSFGDSDTNDISVCFDNTTQKVEELSCRIDLRHINIPFLEKTLALAIKFDCLLMDKQGRLYEPTVKELIQKIQLSNANRFVSDPTKFLNDLSDGSIRIE